MANKNGIVKVSHDDHLFSTSVPESKDTLETGLRNLLKKQAEYNGITVDQVVQKLSRLPDGTEKQNEITNRIRAMQSMAKVLAKRPIDIDALKGACKEQWVLQNGQDSIHRNAFLASGVAAQAIEELLDHDSGIDDQTRIDDFIQKATANGYASPTSADRSGAAQFASVLLSAVMPERFVDFRDKRWTRFYIELTESKKRLFGADSYGLRLIKAGRLAALLANTDAFKQYFDEEYGTWKVAGLAWYFKSGVFDMNGANKRYWAGGFLWGGQGSESESHLDEFIEGNLWRTGYSRSGAAKKHADHWSLFDQIKVGDEFAIKGYGGRNDLKIYYIGSVNEIEPEKGILHLEKLERKLFHGKAPSAGNSGNWFGTIVPVVNPDAIKQVFHCESIPEPLLASPIGLNTILYGPPGTGKTYALRNEYMKMFTEAKGIKSKYQFAQELVESLSWWEVITLVMFELESAKVAEILSHPLMVARIARSENRNPRAAIWAHLQMHTKRGCETVAYLRRYEPLMFSKSDTSVWSIDRTIAQAEVPELLQKLDAYNNFQPSQGADIKRYVFTTFHQSFSYEDFIEGIKPVMGDEVAGDLAYEMRAGVFKQIAQRARMDPANDYAIFIDEINRGNVASIFGELITLLEDDKRIGAPNELTTTLPYSHDVFGVPSNLYVIGTMNTADRSVEALDTALRRRFTFLPCRPNPGLLRGYQPKSLQVDLEKLLVTINARIERLLDDDHCIGHSYFMGLMDMEDPLEGLRHVFANKVLPLLQEYFYGDPARVGMVLGKEFVKRCQDACDLARGPWDPEGIDEREVYDFSDPMELPEEAFVSIYA